jgi:hypothetical protein
LNQSSSYLEMWKPPGNFILIVFRTNSKWSELPIRMINECSK